MTRWMATLTAATVLGGCALLEGSPTPNRYLLQPEPAPATYATTELTLGIRPLVAARPYALRMVHLDENGMLADYPNDEWALEPEDVVTLALIDALDSTKRFQDAGIAADMARPDIVLTGEVLRFDEDRTLEPHEAVVEIRAAARPAREVDPVWTGTVRVGEPMQGEGAAAFREAMETAIERAAAQVAEAIAGAVE